MKCMKPGHARRQGCGHESSTSARRVTPFQLGPARAGSGESDTNEETLAPTTHTPRGCLGRVCAVHSQVLYFLRRKTGFPPRHVTCPSLPILRKGALRRLTLQRRLIADRLMFFPSEPLLTFVE